MRENIFERTNMRFFFFFLEQLQTPAALFIFRDEMAPLKGNQDFVFHMRRFAHAEDFIIFWQVQRCQISKISKKKKKSSWKAVMHCRNAIQIFAHNQRSSTDRLSFVFGQSGEVTVFLHCLVSQTDKSYTEKQQK